ncbi:MAG TPA: hypothetical protein VJ417_11890 [Candidatus Glassbacteria bacterium]|nr:hypothetical protein [Candidatus Glassbacteria bacterium]
MAGFQERDAQGETQLDPVHQLTVADQRVRRQKKRDTLLVVAGAEGRDRLVEIFRANFFAFTAERFPLAKRAGGQSGH